MVSLRARLAAAVRALAVCLIAHTAVAADPTPPAPAVQDPVALWLSNQADIQTWSARFLQTRALKPLAQPDQSEGRVWFQAPDRFRWELGQPAQTVAVRQSNEVVVLYPRLRRAERYPLSPESTGPWSQMLSLLEAGFPKNRQDLDARFTITSETRTNDAVHLELRPKSSTVRRMLPKLRIVLSATHATLQATELVFADGSSMRNDFSEAQINPPLDPQTFHLTLGPEVTVTEPLRNTKKR